VANAVRRASAAISATQLICM